MNGPVDASSLDGRLAALSPAKREYLETLLRARDAASGPIPRRGHGSTARLSFAQSRLWFLDQLSPDSPWYNLIFSIPLDTRVDRQLLQRAVDEVVRRHESLRTTFDTADGRPVQRIAPAMPVPLRYQDVREVPVAERESRLLQLATEETRRPFDLSAGPLLRLLLVQTGDATHVLIVGMHHIISDGLSAPLFAGELSAAYESLAAGVPPALPPLPLQYGDYAEWQHRWVSGERLASQLAYWKGRLAGIPPLELPCDRPRPALPSFTGAYEYVDIPSKLVTALDELGRQEQVTTYMVLLAAFQALLLRYSGQEDFAVGCPIAGRHRPELERLIGLFVNTVVMRAELQGDPTFRELLARVRRTAVGAYANQDVPLERLVEDLHGPRDLARNPLFQVTFQLLRLPDGDGRQAPSRPLLPERGTAHMDLALDLYQYTGSIAGPLEDSTDLFDAATIRQMVRHFLRLLTQVTAAPDCRLSHLDLLTPEETTRMLVDWNATERAYPAQAVTAAIDQAVRSAPGATAVISGTRHVSYQEVDADAAALADVLRRHGVAPGGLVAIALERSVEMVTALLAVWKAGAAMLPIDPANPDDWLTYVVSDAQPVAVITRESVRHRLPAGMPVVALDHNWHGSAAPSSDGAALRAHDLAYVIYTSGSTGRPKGVEITHGALANHMLWWADAVAAEASDAMLQKYSLTFDVALVEILGPLMCGGRVILADPGRQWDGAHLIGLMAEHRVTLLDVVPAQLRLLLEEPAFASLTALRHVGCGGEALPAEVVKRFAAASRARLVNLYGPTEATITATSWECDGDAASAAAPIGRPIANTQAYVLDGARRPVPPRVAGELYLGGVGLARGYRHDPARTAERFVDVPCVRGARFYRTGDRARFRGDGTLEFLGRVDDQLKLRGYRLEPAEVEHALAQHPGVAECAVTLTHGTGGEASLGAWVVPRAEPELWPSVGEYFLYDPLLYRAMTHDEARNRAYEAAVSRLVRGRTVVDIGTGADAFLARMCVEHGAARVYAIEFLADSFERARSLVATLGLTDRIHLIRGDARDVALPEQVDVSVSELLGMIASSEGVAPILNAARRFLKPGASIVPMRSATRIAAVTLPDSLAPDPRFTEISGPYVAQAFERVGHPFDLRVCVRHFPRSLVLSDAATFEDLDFRAPVPEHGATAIRLTMARAGRLDGLLLWLVAETAPGEIIDSLTGEYHWLPVFFPVFYPGLAVAAGDAIDAVATVRPSDNGLTPDYEVRGTLHRAAGGDAPFAWRSTHHGSVFRASPFYHRLLEDGFAGRFVMPGAAVDATELRVHLGRLLPSYMVPASFATLPRLPRTASGKVDRKRLAATAAAEPRRPTAFTPPRTEMERTLAAAWQQVLGVADIGVTDNFFDVGGHSLLIVQLRSRLRQERGLDVAVLDMFRFPTIRSLAEHLTAAYSS